MRYLTSLLTAAVTSFILSSTVVAQESDKPVYTQGVFCDEASQSLAFVKMWDGTNATSAREAINKEAGKDTACLFMEVMILEVEEYETITTSTGTWISVKVVVVAIHSPEGWLVVSPLEQYTFRKIADPPKQSSI